MVFTFLLSTIMFGFQLPGPSVAGGAAIIAATLIYETDGEILGQVFLSEHRRLTKGKTMIRRWHYILLVIMGTTFMAAMFPTRHASLTDAAWELMMTPEDPLKLHPLVSMPTVAMADMSSINARLLQGARSCGWGIGPQRQSTRSAFGWEHSVASVSCAGSSIIVG